MNFSTEDLVTITKTVLNTMLDTDVEESPLPREMQQDRIIGCVQISGAWQGALIIQTDQEFATRAACIMLRMKPEDVGPEDHQDVLGELANMIGGNVKSLVPGPSNLTLPAVTTGRHFHLRLLDASLLCSIDLISSENHSLQVQIWESQLVPNGHARPDLLAGHTC